MAMQNKYAEVTPRNFNPMWSPGLSDEARKAVKRGLRRDVHLAHRDRQKQREKQRASHRETSCRRPGAGMARTNRRYHSRANAEHHQNADPNDGSDDGRLGGADQITEPDDRLAVGDAVEAKVLARHQPDRQLAERKRVGDEPHAVLDAMGGAVAESLGRRDAPPLILESRAAAYSWPARHPE